MRLLDKYKGWNLHGIELSNDFQEITKKLKQKQKKKKKYIYQASNQKVSAQRGEKVNYNMRERFANLISDKRIISKM